MSAHWPTLRRWCPQRLLVCLKGWCKNPFDDIGLRYLSLEFKDPGMEKGYAAAKSTRLARMMANVGLAVTFMEIFWVSISRVFIVTCYSREECDIRWASTIADISSGSAGFFLCLIGQLQLRWSKLSSRQLEVSLVLFGILLLAIAPFTEAPYTAVITGNPSLRDIDGDDPAWLLLFIDTVVTACSLMPVRWSSVWVLQLLAMVWYPLVRGLVLRDLRIVKFAHPLTVACLALLAMLGKRAMEVQERRGFFSVACERTLRARSEFMLSQGASRARPQSRSDEDGCESTVLSMETGEIFDARAAVRHGTEEALRRIQSVARTEQWLIQSDDVSLYTSHILGRGGFGVVIEGCMSGLPVAVKLTLERVQDDGAKRLASTMSELRVLRKLRHPNITLFYGALIDPELGEVAPVIELVAGPDLKDFVSSSQSSMTDRVAYGLVGGMSRALRYMHAHQPPIVHGDMKPSNVLLELAVSGVHRPKLVDFGLSRIMAGRVRAFGGTMAWVAPEVMATARATAPDVPVDMYGLGLIIIFMLGKRQPFEGCGKDAIREALKSGRVPVPRRPLGLSPVFEDLWGSAELAASWDPSFRPESESICVQLQGLAALPACQADLGSLARDLWGAGHGSLSLEAPERPPEPDPWSEGVQELRRLFAGRAGEAPVAAVPVPAAPPPSAPVAPAGPAERLSSIAECQDERTTGSESGGGSGRAAASGHPVPRVSL